MLELQDELLGAWQTTLPAHDWRVWTHQLFVRSFITASSLRMLCYGTKNKGIITDQRHLDVSSISNLARAIYESYLIYKFIIIDSQSDNDRKDYLLQAFEFGSRFRLLDAGKAMKKPSKEILEAEQEIEKTKIRLKSHSYFSRATDKEKTFAVYGINPTKNLKFSKLSDDPDHQLLQVLQIYPFHSLHTHPTFYALHRQVQNTSIEAGFQEINVFVLPHVSMILAIMCKHYSTLDKKIEEVFLKSAHRILCLKLCEVVKMLPPQYLERSK